MSRSRFTLSTLAATAALCASAAAQAASVVVTVNIENLAPTNSLSFAALQLGFHNGSFDGFNIGEVAGPGIAQIAERGAGTLWQNEFRAADPTAVVGTIATPGSQLRPGNTRSMSFVVDTDLNRYFSFASMAVPSNDFFIGNDSPTEYLLFNAAGELQLSSITVKANEVWDAGSEVFDPAAAAFVGNSALRADQNSVVAFNFGEFYGFNGRTTAAGYTFDAQLGADTDIYRISLSAAPVPEPETYALMLSGLALMGALARRRSRKA